MADYIIKTEIDSYTQEQYRDKQMAQLQADIKAYELEHGSITGEYMAANSIGELHIIQGSIGAVHIQEASISSAAIMNAAIQTAHLGLAIIESAHIKDATIETAKIKDASITTAKIGNAQITKAKIGNAQIINAHIDRVTADRLVVESADIKDAAITSAKIGQASIDSVHIKNGAVDTLAIKAGAVDTLSIKDAAINGVKIANASIESAHIKEIVADKILSGTLSTAKVTISGEGGFLRLNGNRIQVFDNQTVPVERVAMGDVNNDGSVFGFLMRGADGKTVLMDINGVKNAGITDGAITNPKIGDNAIDDRVIKTDAIIARHIVAEQISATHLAPKTITANKIASNTITANELVVGTITAASGIIANAAIDTAHIIDGAITNAKISNLQANKITVVDGAAADGNIAAGKSASGSYTGTGASDGVKSIGSAYVSYGSGNSTDNSAEGSYLQYDLGQAYRLEESRIYFYAGDDRFYWYKVKYSIDGTNWFYAVGTASNTGWKKSVKRSVSGGTEFSPTVDKFSIPITARYIRLYSNGNSVNTGNHIYEWELYSAQQTTIHPDSLTTGTINADLVSIANSKVTLNSAGVTVTDGDFMLKDSAAGTIYSIVEKTNLIHDHSFEMVKDNGGAMNSDGTFNLDTSNPEEFRRWATVGTPRLETARYGGLSSGIGAMYGIQAVLINSSNQVKQTVKYSAGKTYTLSAFYKKHPKFTAGTPRFAIRLLDDLNTVVWSQYPSFSAVSDTVKRFSHTFTVPTGTTGTALEILLYAVDGNWVMVDGVQLVEGNKPTVYNPENSLFEYIRQPYQASTLKADMVTASGNGVATTIYGWNVNYEIANGTHGSMHNPYGENAVGLHSNGSVYVLRSTYGDEGYMASFTPTGASFDRGIKIENWKTPTLSSPWRNYGGAYANIGYKKDPMGFVHLRGLATGGSTTLSQDPMFQLPAGYRPAGRAIFICSGGGDDRIRVDVNTDGWVYAMKGSGTLASLEGITFYADN